MSEKNEFLDSPLTNSKNQNNDDEEGSQDQRNHAEDEINQSQVSHSDDGQVFLNINKNKCFFRKKLNENLFQQIKTSL